MGTTNTAGMYKPASGERGWGDKVNANFDKVKPRFNDRGTQTAAVGNLAVWDSIAYKVTSASISEALPSSGLVAGDEIEVYLSATSGSNTLTLTDTGGPFVFSIAGYRYVLRWLGSAWGLIPGGKDSSALDGRYQKLTRSLLGTEGRKTGVPSAVAAPVTITQNAGATTVTNNITYSLTSRSDLFSVFGAHVAITGRDANYAGPDSITPNTINNDLSGIQCFAIEFLSDTGKFGFRVRDFAGKYRILVDLLDGKGWQYAVDSSATSVVTNSGSGIRVEVDATSLGGSGTMRLWRIESDAMLVREIVFSKQDTVTARSARRPRCIVAGDSATEGTGALTRMDAFPGNSVGFLGGTFGHRAQVVRDTR